MAGMIFGRIPAFDEVMAAVSDLGPIEEKFRVFGWEVRRGDGHDFRVMRDTFETTGTVMLMVGASALFGVNSADGRGNITAYAGVRDPKSSSPESIRPLPFRSNTSHPSSLPGSVQAICSPATPLTSTIRWAAWE